MAKRANARNAGAKERSESLDEIARQEMLSALEEMLAQQDFELSVPYNRLNAGIKSVIENNGKVISKLQEKIIRGIGKELTNHDNGLDRLRTLVMNGINSHQADMEFLLTQLATKGGHVKVGDPLESALIAEATRAPELAYGATMVLEVSRLAPWLERIAIALEEIRDRLPNMPSYSWGPEQDQELDEPEAIGAKESMELEEPDEKMTWGEV